MIGKVLSHYKILEHLGGGGMGVVYKAQDLKLDRPVALKFLHPELTRDPEAKERFIHEAKTASSLQHNNICVVHDIDETPEGQMFLCMEYLDGESLKKRIDRGPLSVKEAVAIAIQAAQGLARAHEHGIVHRDVKPANVMVTSDGVAKLVDFGLAKLTGQSMLTRPGSTLGTVAYMSPEQARGDPTDRRTDIWSLGVVLSEMLVGKRPFDAEYEQATIFKILNEPAPSIESANIPPRLARVVNRALSKDPASRYGEAGSMADELLAIRKTLEEPARPRPHRRWVPALIAGVAALVVLSAGLWFLMKRSVPAGSQKSIAVLPITPITKSKSDQEFADGLHDHLLTQLARIRDVTVISRQSVLQYKETQKRSRQIASELGVGMLLEASVQLSGSRLRMQVQLIDGASEGHIWANTYDRQLTDIFAVQSDLAQSIVNALQATITPEEKAALEKSWTSNQQALELYMKGSNLWAVALSKEGNLRAAELLDQAARLDTQFAAAYAMAAHVHTNIFAQGSWDSSPSRLARAQAALRRAVELDPALPETHLASGSYARLVTRDFGEAERELESVLSVRPNDYEATHELAFLNVQLRRLDPALRLFERAEVLNPLAPSGGMDSWTVACMLRRWDDAIRLSDRYISRLPDDQLGWGLQAVILVDGLGDFNRAEETLRRGEEWGRSHPWVERGSGSLDVLAAVRAYLAYMRREYSRAAAMAMKTLDLFGPRQIPHHLFLQCRNEPGVRTALDTIVARTARAVSRASTNRRAWARLALVLSIQGKREESRAAADRARSLITSYDDVWMHNEAYLEWLANTYVILGDHGRALDLLEDLLARPSGLSITKLRLDPVYDPLRGDPRFRALLMRDERIPAQ